MRKLLATLAVTAVAVTAVMGPTASRHVASAVGSSPGTTISIGIQRSAT